jgi:streptogramin lyase
VDGNTLIWFTERVGNKLGRYRYPIGTFHYEFPLPTANSLPTGIAVDGEGCAWYTAPGANQIGRFCLILRYGYLPLVSKPPSR